VLKPLVRRAKNRAMLEVDSILATFGLLFVVQGIMLVVFGGQFNTMNYLSIPVNVLGSNVALNRLIALGFAVIIGTALYLALMRTRQGTAIRARRGRSGRGATGRDRRAQDQRLRLRARRRARGGRRRADSHVHDLPPPPWAWSSP
jgi:hypothetical protein